MQQLGSAPFSFDLFVVLAWLGIFLYIGILLRGKIRFMQRWLVPSCMLGGLAGFFILNGLRYLFPEGASLLPAESIIQATAWHMYTILFIGIILTSLFPKPKSDASEQSIQEEKGENLRGAFWYSFMYRGFMAYQSLIACLAILLFSMVFGEQIFVSSGLLVGAAFAGGPGSAMGTGAIWQQAGHSDFISIGLGFAGVGFLFSLFVGVTVVNLVRRKMCINLQDDECIPLEEQRGIYPDGEGKSAGNLTFLSSNVETMAFVVATIVIVYFIAYAFMETIKLFLPIKIMAMLWNLFPVLCIFVAFFCGQIIRKIGLFRFLDHGLLSRLQGFLVDFMGIAALMGISLTALLKYAPLMLTVSLVVMVATMVYLYFMCRKLKVNSAEALVFTTGWATGTVTSGLILLRMIDPNLESPVVLQVSMAQIIISTISIFIQPLVLPFYNGEALFGWSYWPLLGVLLVETVVFFALARLPMLHLYGKKAHF